MPTVVSGPVLSGLLRLRVLASDESEPDVEFPSVEHEDGLSSIDHD